MSNKRIVDFDEITSTEDDDYVLVDHATSGTRKIKESAIGGRIDIANLKKIAGYIRNSNLIMDNYSTDSSGLGVTFTKNEDKTITLTGTGSGQYVTQSFVLDTVNLKKGVTYTLSGVPENNISSLKLRVYKGSKILANIGSNETVEFTPDEDCYDYNVMIRVAGVFTLPEEGVTVSPMLSDSGSTTYVPPTSSIDKRLDVIEEQLNTLISSI